MPPEELREARESLGLTQTQAAEVLETDAITVARFERAEGSKSHRKPPRRVVRLYRAYLDGYRPADWPVSVEEQA